MHLVRFARAYAMGFLEINLMIGVDGEKELNL
jgi:hypothetical protein